MANEKWKLMKKAELLTRIEKLAQKIVFVTYEIKRFGPYKVRRGFKVFYNERNGMIRHWHKMALRSLGATRKKIYRLKAELDSL